jgi:hypothetical protein
VYTLIAKNKYGQELELTHNEAYVIESIEGLDPPDAVINTTRNANAAGSIFNSSYVDNRQITITLAINGPAEVNRINLYKYFKGKYPVTLYYKNDTRDVYITGYVQNIQIEFFNKKQIAQIIILCPEPFFSGSDSNITDFANVESLFEFPFSIETPVAFSQILPLQKKNIINRGDVETGAIFRLKATGSATNPMVFNDERLEFIGFNLTMSAGDELVINTNKKHKSAKLTHNGVTSSVINKISMNSTWIQLLPGDNIIGIYDDTLQNLTCIVEFEDKYEGV